MIIKKEGKKKNNSFFSFKTFAYFYFFSSILLGSIFIFAILQSQTLKQKKNEFLEYLSKGGRYEYLYLPNIAFNALKSFYYDIDKVNLEIGFDDILIIENLRKKSISNGTLPTRDQIPKIKASIIFDGEKYRGDIRLKGDRLAHFEDKNKSSYKVELDRNQYLFGMKKFSFQKPRLRNYIHEWIFHEIASDFDLIKINYKFINLSINGEDKGLYVVEEGFGKELIERNERRNGPIFSLDEDIIGENYEKNKVFEIYNKKYWAKKENNSLARIASQKLRDFFDDKLELNKVFDLEKWAAYFAVVDLTASYHGALLKSVKLYYNPLNGLFEPIPFDGHRLKPNFNKYNLNYDNRILIDIIIDPNTEEERYLLSWLKKFFFQKGQINQEFYNLYIKNLNTISSQEYSKKFLDNRLNDINEINSHIYSDYFFFDNTRNYGVGLYYFSLSDFNYQAENIRKKLKIKRKIQVLKISDSEFLVKNFYKNYGSFFAKDFICNKNNQIFIIPINKKLNNFSDTVINIGKDKVKNLQCTHLNFINEYSKKLAKIKIDYINSEYSYNSQKNIKFEVLNKFFFQKEKNLFLIEDETEISQNLFIPTGFKVIIKPGQKIILTNNAFIISNSPWEIGGKGNKTVISGKENNYGGGILIGDTEEESKIQNTLISYMKGYDLNTNPEFLILGSINFHETKVQLNEVEFTNIDSEDAINIFRSDFKIINVSYADIASDAIDIDFSDGEIDNAKFLNVLNDAIDFSGSNATIRNSYFSNVKDKIVSAGEKSKINIYKINGDNSYVGIVSKDGSEVFSMNTKFDGVAIPFAAYQKKKEYDFGKLIAKNFDIQNFNVKWIRDKNSKIIVNDKLIKQETKKIIPIIYEKKLFLLK